MKNCKNELRPEVEMKNYKNELSPEVEIKNYKIPRILHFHLY